MVMPWPSKGFSPIAIDFGVDSIKLLQVVPGDPPRLFAAAKMAVPPEARTNPVARASFLPEALRKLTREQEFHGRRVVCAIPALHTIVQNLQISTAEHPDIDGQVADQLRRRLNVDPSRMVIRSLSVDTPGRGQKQEILCIAARRDVVMQYVGIARQAKLEVVGMQCEPLAVMESFAHLYRRKHDDQLTTALIDIGAGTTKFVIAHGSKVVFAKTIHAAGDHLIRHYAKSHDVDFSEAREARIDQADSKPVSDARESGFASPVDDLDRVSGATPGRGSAGVAMLDTAVATDTKWRPQLPTSCTELKPDDTLECLVDELSLSLRYHQSLFPDRGVDKIVFLGGESCHRWLCQKIAQLLRLGAQLGDPLARLVRGSKKPPGIDLRRPQPGWAVPMGLCLGETNL